MQSKSSRGVQQHEVDAAADVLVAERQRPTIERVRQKLRRGSPNTIAPMLETWFATLAPRLGVATSDAEICGVPAEVRGVAETLWSSALALAQTQAAGLLQSERDALAHERLGLAAGHTALDAARAQLVQHETMLRDALSTAQSQAEESKQRFQRSEVELARSNAELANVRDSLGKSVVERDAERCRYDNQLQAAAQERERQQERASSNERRLLEEVDRARQEAKQMRAELTAMGKKHEAAQVELLWTQQQLNQVKGDHKATVAALTEKVAAAERRVVDFRNALKFSASNAKPIARNRTKVRT